MDGAKEDEEGEEKETRTYMNKCPYEWRHTFNIQNQNRTENTRTHTYIFICIYQERLFENQRSRFR